MTARLLLALAAFLLLFGKNEIIATPARETDVQELDHYGGCSQVSIPGGRTSYFHLARLGHRVVLVTPEGHAFWVMAVYGLDQTDGGSTYQKAVQSKYPNNAVWAQQSVRRLRSWGFNTIGEYYAVGSRDVLPVPTYHQPPNKEKMPFIRFIRPAAWCLNAPHLVKNLYAGTDPTIFFTGRSFPDVFDPNWVSCVNQIGPNSAGEFQPPLSQAEPWMIGTTADDADDLYGFASGPDTKNHGIPPHLGWIAAVSAPMRSVDGTVKPVYAKQAWQQYLQGKYKAITTLNAAWGSSYTTFGSDGGWPYGSGLMDENGRKKHAWLGTNELANGANANCLADLDNFLYQIAVEYFKPVQHSVKTAFPHHLIFGPASINGDTRPQVLQAEGQFVDVVETWADPSRQQSLVRAYQVSGKPLLAWTTLTSQRSSAANGGAPWGSGTDTGDYDYSTQNLRGSAYPRVFEQYWKTLGTDGISPIIGLDWWEWTDKTMQGENMNFGLVTNLDNAYDGTEDRVLPGKDAWAYTTGGEARAYGDFLSDVSRSNRSACRRLKDEVSGGAKQISSIQGDK
jgi:hypothetical protein